MQILWGNKCSLGCHEDERPRRHPTLPSSWYFHGYHHHHHHHHLHHHHHHRRRRRRYHHHHQLQHHHRHHHRYGHRHRHHPLYVRVGGTEDGRVMNEVDRTFPSRELFQAATPKYFFEKKKSFLFLPEMINHFGDPNVNVLHLYSAICLASEALLTILYSAPSQGRLWQCRVGFEHDTLRLLPLPPYAGT